MRAFSCEVERVKACATIGEAMQLASELSLTWVPGIPDDGQSMLSEGMAPG